MVTENNGSKSFSFKSFLEQYHVVIPMVQRDYAQGRTTDDVTRVRNRFLDAIKSYLVKSEDDNDVMKMDFIYGEYGAQNEAYKYPLAKNVANDLCFS